MLKNILNIKFEMNWGVEHNETKETKTIADYLPSVPNEADKIKAQQALSKTEKAYKQYLEQHWNSIDPKEIEDWNKAMEKLIKQEQDKIWRECTFFKNGFWAE